MLLKQFPLSKKDYEKIIKPYSWWNNIAGSPINSWHDIISSYIKDINSLFTDEGKQYIQSSLSNVTYEAIKHTDNLFKSELDTEHRRFEYTDKYNPNIIYPTFPLIYIRLILNDIFSFYSLLPIEWFERFASHPYIKNKKILEIFAGSGILSLGLQFNGVTIHPTDNLSWFKKDEVMGIEDNLDQKHSRHGSIYINDIEQLDALEAVEKYKDDYEVLLFSWPPIDDPISIEACRMWSTKHPDGIIVYIGETKEGCTGCRELYEEYVTIETFPMYNYRGIHDLVMFMKRK